MPTLEGKTAIVTGSSRGIGAAIAKRLAAEGATVAINYAGSKDRAEAVVKEVISAGGQAFAVQADVSKPEDVARLFEVTDERFDGGLDILVNNAGVFEVKPVHEWDLDSFDRVMNINVRGVFDASRHAAPRLRNGGRIVTLGSCVASRSMMPGFSVYSMSKAAVVGLTRALAQDLGDRGITANCVQPGPIDTDMNPDSPDNAGAEAMKSMTALKRYGKAEEIAALVGYLASPESQFITGQVITIDGGMNA